MSAPNETAYDLISNDPGETQRLGERLGALLRSGDVVCLQGELGSGKTCLTQGIGRGLGVRETISSPTFVFVNEYRGAKNGPCLYHVDLYRIENLDAAYGLGLDDYLYGDGVTVVEWAERARDFMPARRLWITLHYLDPHRRGFRFDPWGEAQARTVATLLAAFGGRRSGERGGDAAGD